MEKWHDSVKRGCNLLNIPPSQSHSAQNIDPPSDHIIGHSAAEISNNCINDPKSNYLYDAVALKERFESIPGEDKSILGICHKML